MYTEKNFKSKKALKEAISNGEEIFVYQPGPFGGGRETGPKTVFLEGPHYPKAHTWYAQAEIDETGKIIKIK